jgi:ubiquinone biosynthesis protein Coq4
MLMLSLIIGSWLTLTSTYNEADMMSGLSDVKPAFDGIRRIQRLKSMQVDQTVELTNKGQQLKHDLDSLVRLPIKSHKDSVDIMVKYRQLELVVKYLDNKQ